MGQKRPLLPAAAVKQGTSSLTWTEVCTTPMHTEEKHEHMHTHIMKQMS